MTHKVPEILCETCTYCKRIGIARAGNILVECHPFPDKSITHHSGAMGKCKYYLPEKEVEE